MGYPTAHAAPVPAEFLPDLPIHGIARLPKPSVEGGSVTVEILRRDQQFRSLWIR